MVIPAGLRRSLDIKSGETLLARIEDDSLILESRDTVLRRIKDRFAHISKDMSLADELIEERRMESRIEREL